MEKKRGLFIVFEGVDRAGKSTQAKLLQEYFESKEDVVVRKAYPNRNSESGKMIAQMLKGDKPLHPKASHLIFSFDRWKERDDILDVLKRGEHLIVDRYAFSGVVYSLAQNAPKEWVMIPDQGLPRPDIVFQLDLEINQTKERADFGGELYEKENFQNSVRENYEIFNKYKYWKKINANRSIEEIHKEILFHLEELLARYQTSPQNNVENNLYPDKIAEDLFTAFDT